MNNVEKNKLKLMLGQCLLVYAVLVLIIAVIDASDSIFWSLLLSLFIFIVGVVVLLISKREEDVDMSPVYTQKMKSAFALFVSIFLGSFIYLIFSPIQEISSFSNLLITVNSALFGSLFSYLLLSRTDVS